MILKAPTVKLVKINTCLTMTFIFLIGFAFNGIAQRQSLTSYKLATAIVELKLSEASWNSRKPGKNSYSTFSKCELARYGNNISAGRRAISSQVENLRYNLSIKPIMKYGVLIFTKIQLVMNKNGKTKLPAFGIIPTG